MISNSLGNYYISFRICSNVPEIIKWQVLFMSKKTKNLTDQIFDNVSKEELIEFVKKQFDNCSNLENSLITHFAEHIEQDAETKYKTIVKNIIQGSDYEYDVESFYDPENMLMELDKLLDRAKEFLENKNLRDSLAICKAVFDNGQFLHELVDEGFWEVEETIENTFDIFEKITEKAPPLLKDDLFEFCVNKFQDHGYNDFGGSFLFLLPVLISTEEQENKFLELLDQKIDYQNNKETISWNITKFINLKYEYLSENGNEEAAWKLLEDNKRNPEILNKLVDKYVDLKDYQAAVDLCNYGIKIAKEFGLHGKIINWEEKLLSIYESTNNIEEIRRISEKMFFMKHYDMLYYKKLKRTYNNDGWQHENQRIINRIKGEDQSGNRREAFALADIFVEENYKERLLKLLQLNSADIEFIDDFSKHLKSKYPDELIYLYEKAIKKYAENTGRQYYHAVARYLKRLQKINGGKESVQKLLRQFRHIYKRRRAMMEILDKNFGKFE